MFELNDDLNNANIITGKKGEQLMTRKISIIIFILIALVMGMGAALTSCDNDPKPAAKPNLTGTVKIKGTMEVGETTVEAEIAGSNGTAGKFTYKWTKAKDDGQALEITGANGATYKITESDADHVLGAIIGNDGTLGKISGVSASAVVAREFSDLTLLGKSVKIVDQTGNSQSLKTRGIWQIIQNALTASDIDPNGMMGTKWNTIHATGNFAIVIETNKTYPNGYYRVDGHKIFFSDDLLSDFDSQDITDCIDTAIMNDMTVAQGKKQNRVRFGSGMSPFELAQATQSNRHRNHLVYHCT